MSLLLPAHVVSLLGWLHFLTCGCAWQMFHITASLTSWGLHCFFDFTRTASCITLSGTACRNPDPATYCTSFFWNLSGSLSWPHNSYILHTFKTSITRGYRIITVKSPCIINVWWIKNKILKYLRKKKTMNNTKVYCQLPARLVTRTIYIMSSGFWVPGWLNLGYSLGGPSEKGTSATSLFLKESLSNEFTVLYSGA
jgi:hypothetical protein